jgi:two-component system torCAD operon response regulator TorR
MAVQPFHVLIVEDEEVTRAKLAGYLEVAGHRVLEATDGQEMWAVLEREPVDLVLLDINMPGEDGIDLTRQLRGRSDIGIILVTGRVEEVDRIVGLEIGADDYITKPFNPRELLARVKNLLRRSAGGLRPDDPERRFAGWRFNVNTRKLVSPSGERVPLTRAEYELLLALVEHPGVVMVRERLLDCVTHRNWDPSDRTIDVLISRLRQKIETDPKHPEMIVTAHGEGYIFAVEADVP